MSTSEEAGSNVFVADEYKLDGITRISLNSLVHQELNNDSSLAKGIVDHYRNAGAVSDTLLFEVLKKHLSNVDPSEQILLYDRRITIPPHLVGQAVSNVELGQMEEVILSAENLDSSETPAQDELVESELAASNDVLNEMDSEGDNNATTTAVHQESQESKLKKIRQMLGSLRSTLVDKVKTSRKPDDKNWLMRYLSKMRGGEKKPPKEKVIQAVISFINSFVGMVILTSIDQYFMVGTKNTLVIGSFGATAVLLYSAIKSPLAQPKNLLVGHFLAALIGVTMQILLGTNYPCLAGALAVSLTIAITSLAQCVHPPAGATALIAVYSDQRMHSLGFMYTLIPVISGVFIMLLVAVVMNNLFPSRKYPQYWY